MQTTVTLRNRRTGAISSGILQTVWDAKKNEPGWAGVFEVVNTTSPKVVTPPEVVELEARRRGRPRAKENELPADPEPATESTAEPAEE